MIIRSTKGQEMDAKIYMPREKRGRISFSRTWVRPGNVYKNAEMILKIDLASSTKEKITQSSEGGRRQVKRIKEKKRD